VSVLDLFRLDGKTALVTGARRGIGKAMAIALAEAGAGVIAVSRTLDNSSELAGVKSYACDFANRGEVHDFVRQVQLDFPVIDILVNNAGTIYRKPAAEHPDEAWDQIIETNLNSQFVLSREIGKRMIERRRGKIIFTASLLTFQGGITVPGYAASKGAIGQLTKALANEWAPHNVQVNAIAPGYVETDVTTALRNDPHRAPAILSRIPAGRWGDPADFKGVTVFLASAASDYVTGTIVVVDGGWMAR